jgi:hypothetical protein
LIIHEDIELPVIVQILYSPFIKVDVLHAITGIKCELQIRPSADISHTDSNCGFTSARFVMGIFGYLEYFPALKKRYAATQLVNVNHLYTPEKSASDRGLSLVELKLKRIILSNQSLKGSFVKATPGYGFETWHRNFGV